MLAPLELTNGLVGTPSLSFDSDTNTGLYRKGADNMALVAGGAEVLDIQTTGVDVTGALAASGAVSGASGAFAGAVSGTTGAFSGNVTLSGADPASTTGFDSVVTPANIIKAWAYIALNGSTGAQTVSGGFNIASATVATVATFGELTITFATPFASATSYSVTGNYSLGIATDIRSQTASTVVIRLKNTDAGAYVVTASTLGMVVMIQAVGTQ
jgi:hypothetical protein